MSEHLNIDTIDVSGTIRQAAEDAGAFEPAGFARRDALRRGAAAGGGLILGAGLFQTMLTPAEAAISKKKKSKSNDVKILQYALTLEYLETAFYAQANANKAWKDASFQLFAETAGKHEADHVAALSKVLGKKNTIDAPEVAFGAAVTDANTFAATAQVIENLGVAAYAGQVNNVDQKAVLAAAAAIHSVEARHAAWITVLNGGGVAGNAAGLPAPQSFDPAYTEKKVLSTGASTGFVPALKK